MNKKKKPKKDKSNNIEVWTEEQYEEYIKEQYGMECIAGFTENGVPYGIVKEESNELCILNISDIYDDELPF